MLNINLPLKIIFKARRGLQINEKCRAQADFPRCVKKSLSIKL